MSEDSAPAPATPELLHEFFARAAAAHPDRIAVEVPPGLGRPDRLTATYAELDSQAVRIRAALAGAVRADCVVAILLWRGGIELYAAQLGVLSAGAAYVCLDAGFPDDALRHVLDDARVVAALGDAASLPRLRRLVGADVAVVDVAVGVAVGVAVAAPAAVARPTWLTPQSLAYLIYTSGTTGRPKGVMLEHRGVVNLIAADVDAFGLGPDDRVAQGSSPAYDSSVEETWLAWSVGATVVAMDEATARLGPDLVGWLRDQRISVLCPPPTLLRTTGCAEPWLALPGIRLIYAGGEALPQDLADRWARGRRFVNGYGPTECTVTVVRGDVRPGEPITIGWPVRGHTAHVLDEQLEPVADGEAGELCISGPGLARGYLGRAELTAERFPIHERVGRIYRTGDRVRRRADGALLYEGRLDSQVKLRGHRVELGEIEARLAELPGVREAACRVGAGERLLAFVVPVERASPPRGDELASALREQLPAHMVPVGYGVVAALPTTVGGKLDRNALPDTTPDAVEDVAGRDPRDTLEARIAESGAVCLGIARLPCDVDFFDLGGDSVRAAAWISSLRDDVTTAALAVRDVYEQRTVEGLAARARLAVVGAARAPRAPLGRTFPIRVSLLQAMWLLLELAFASSVLWAIGFEFVPWLLAHFEPLLALVVVPVLAVAAFALFAPVSLAFAVLTKRVLIGRYTASREPVYGLWYLRHWIVQRAARAVPWGLVQGTELQSVALRALGARIGRDVYFHRGVDLSGGGWDLLDIGDGVTVGQDAMLGVAELDDGAVVIAPVRLGAGARLDVRAGVSGDTVVGAGAVLASLASLAPGARIADGVLWDGVPATAVGIAPEPPAVDRGGRPLGPVAHAALVVGLRTIGGLLVGAPFALVLAGMTIALGIDAAEVRAWLASPSITFEGALWIAALLGLALPIGLFAEALALRLGGRVEAGTYALRSLAHVRVMFRTRVVERAGVWLSGTLFWPVWLRLAGMRIGARVEISTILDVLPEQVVIGGDSFFADGIYLAGPLLHRGTVTVGPVSIGRESFVGNHVVIPAGVELADGILLGVCTVVDPQRMCAGSSWFGHPPFELPRREVVAMDRRLTFEPGPIRYLNRVFWEALRFTLPWVPAAAAYLWWDGIVASGGPHWLAVLGWTALIGTALVALVLALKWLLLGRVRPGQHALWSCWCSRWDFLYVAWGFLAAGILERFAGTLWLAWYLRAMGVRVGRRVVLGAGFAQIVDPDMLSFGDGATIETHFQAHSFEDRVLKIDRVTIGSGATLARGTVVLYGADLGDEAHVGPHSVVMKNERLLPQRAYVGVPTRPA